MTLQLLPFQHVGAEFLTSKPRCGLHDEMGVGKTAQAINALDRVGAFRVIVVCPAAVRQVWHGEFKKFAVIPRKILKARTIHDLGVWLKGRADVLLLSYELASKWADKIEDLFDVIIFDECFPATTLVETEHGPLPIAVIVEERIPIRVWSYGPSGLALRWVTRYIKTPAKQLCRIRHSHGDIVCTPNHKIWTEQGYVAAESLENGTALRVVQSAVHPSKRPTVLQQKVLGELAEPASSFIAGADGKNDCGGHGSENRQTAPRRIGEDEAPQFRSGISRQSGCCGQVAERPKLDRPAGRQRLYRRAAAAFMRGLGLAGKSNGSRGADRSGETPVRLSAESLQNRHSLSCAEAGDRSRRPEPQHEAMALSRQEEDCRIERAWVESVEIYEPRSDERLTVYNLEVEEHHNYFADRVLVGNCHYLKNPDSQRTRNMLGTRCDGMSGLARWATRVWSLTGTPMPNDPVDIWPWLHFVGGTKLGRTEFTSRYFKSRMGTFSSSQTPRDEMIPELKIALDAFRLKRTKKQVGLQLPPIHLTTVTVDGDTSEIVALLREWPGLEDAIMDAIEQGGLSFLDAQHIATLRRLVGEAKAPAYAQLAVEEFRNGRDKLVIFTMHTRAAEIIATHLNHEGFPTSIFDGATPERMRIEHIASFQNDPSHRGFVGNIRAAGAGLTLTAAADVDMFEQSWSPADNAQALMRVHRIGQERTVRARFISLAKSIDETVAEVVARKTASIAKIENYGEEAA